MDDLSFHPSPNPTQSPPADDDYDQDHSQPSSTSSSDSSQVNRDWHIRALLDGLMKRMEMTDWQYEDLFRMATLATTVPFADLQTRVYLQASIFRLMNTIEGTTGVVGRLEAAAIDLKAVSKPKWSLSSAQRVRVFSASNLYQHLLILSFLQLAFRHLAQRCLLDSKRTSYSHMHQEMMVSPLPYSCESVHIAHKILRQSLKMEVQMERISIMSRKFLKM